MKGSKYDNASNIELKGDEYIAKYRFNPMGMKSDHSFSSELVASNGCRHHRTAPKFGAGQRYRMTIRYDLPRQVRHSGRSAADRNRTAESQVNQSHLNVITFVYYQLSTRLSITVYAEGSFLSISI